MKPLNKAVLGAVVLFAVIPLSDAVVQGLTGGSVLDLLPESPAVDVVVETIHLLVYLGLIAVLVRNARDIDAGRRSRTVLRVLTALAFVLLTVTTGVAMAFFEEQDEGMGAVVTAAFLLTLVVPPLLGVTMILQGDRSPGAWLLAAGLPVFVATAVLLELGTTWAHPGYTEVLIALGTALLGARAGEGSALRTRAGAGAPSAA